MIAALLLALPMAVLWMLVLGDLSLESFGVGLVLGFLIGLLLRVQHVPVSWRRMPDQLIALFIYTVTLLGDVVMSSIEVARIVLNPRLPLNPGVIPVPTQDETESDFIAAFSAHGITITPGELVIDFDDPKEIMYVHCLDMEASAKTADAAQTRRLSLLRRIEGRS